MRRFALPVLLALACLPAALHAQKWKEIGRTKPGGAAKGNLVFVDPASIKRAGDTVTAISMVRFDPAVDDPSRHSKIDALKTLATFDCKTGKVAVKENTWYVNEKQNKVNEHKVIGQPGFGYVFANTFPALVRAYLCTDPKKKS